MFPVHNKRGRLTTFVKRTKCVRYYIFRSHFSFFMADNPPTSRMNQPQRMLNLPQPN